MLLGLLGNMVVMCSLRGCLWFLLLLTLSLLSPLCSAQPQSDLFGLIQVMIVVFGDEPPVFSRPTTQAPHQAFQAAGPPNCERRLPSKWPPTVVGRCCCAHVSKLAANDCASSASWLVEA